MLQNSDKVESYAVSKDIYRNKLLLVIRLKNAGQLINHQNYWKGIWDNVFIPVNDTIEKGSLKTYAKLEWIDKLSRYVQMMCGFGDAHENEDWYIKEGGFHIEQDYRLDLVQTAALFLNKFD